MADEPVGQSAVAEPVPTPAVEAPKEPATGGTVGEPAAEAPKKDWELEYKKLQSDYTRKSQKLSEYEKQGAKPKQETSQVAQAQELLKGLDKDDPAVPVIERLASVLAEQESRLKNIDFGVGKFYQQDLDQKVNNLKTVAEADGFKLDEKALRETIAERNLPLYSEDGEPYDLYELAKAIQPDEYIRSVKAKGVAEYLAAQNTATKNAVPEGGAKTLGEAPAAPGDRTELKGWLKQQFPGMFKD